MKVRGKSMDGQEGHLYHTAVNMFHGQLEDKINIPCEANVFVTQAFMDHGSEAEQCRPYLVLLGEVRSIRGDFPCGVTEIGLGEGINSPRVEYHCSFSNEELAQLCEKGLFDTGFKCPDIFSNNDFELPMVCDASGLSPFEEGDAPLIFFHIHNSKHIELEEKASGYDLADYFEKIEPVKVEEIEDFMAEEQFGEDVIGPDKRPVNKQVEETVYTPTAEELLEARLLREAADRIGKRVIAKVNEAEAEKQQTAIMAEKSVEKVVKDIVGDKDKQETPVVPVVETEKSDVVEEMATDDDVFDGKSKNAAVVQRAIANQTANREERRVPVVPDTIDDFDDFENPGLE